MPLRMHSPPSCVRAKGGIFGIPFGCRASDQGTRLAYLRRSPQERHMTCDGAVPVMYLPSWGLAHVSQPERRLAV